MLVPLTADLLFFTVLAVVISRRLKRTAALLAFVAARFVTFGLFAKVAAPVLSLDWWMALAGQFALCAPGILMLLIISIVCVRWMK